jgi:hypothetical protein
LDWPELTDFQKALSRPIVQWCDFTQSFQRLIRKRRSLAKKWLALEFKKTDGVAVGTEG